MASVVSLNLEKFKINSKQNVPRQGKKNPAEFFEPNIILYKMKKISQNTDIKTPRNINASK